MAEDGAQFLVFEGPVRRGRGSLAEATAIAARALEANASLPVLVFDLDTGRVVDLDPRQSLASGPVASEPARRGRPKLGVVAREVTLLPRHWDWLAAQPGGASVALRRLVEAARKADPEGDAALARRDAAYRFMSAMAGDLPGFEEASRALFAGDVATLVGSMAPWPGDLADQILRWLQPPSQA